jgi:hypothetical protein
MRSSRTIRVRRNTARLICHISSSSVDSQAVRMHHPMRAPRRTDMIAMKIRVKGFEILKQKSNSATKNITILSTEEAFHKREPSITSGDTRDYVRPHKERPGKAEYDGHRFKTESSVTILIQICRLPKRYLSTQIGYDRLLTAPAGSSFCLVRL